MDAIDKAVKAAQQQPAPAPTHPGIRFDINLGPDGRAANVVLPTPITEVDIFNVFGYIARWYFNEREKLEAQQPHSGIVPVSAMPALPPPPGSKSGN